MTIDLYTWPTPNGQKIPIMLEECALPYVIHPVNMLKGEQHADAYVKLNPNHKIPTIVDRDGPNGAPYTVFESGAILMYLAEKTGRFMPLDMEGKYTVVQWLMFQMASVGPMFGQCGHFLGYAPKKIPYAIERYQNETLRLYGVMEKRLGETPFLAGDYSIADMAVWPWIRVRWLHQIEIERFPNVKRWYDEIGERLAVKRGVAVLAEREVIGNPTDDAYKALFGRAKEETAGEGEG